MTPKERASENKSLVYRGIKRCGKCDEIKNLAEFGSKGKGGRKSPICLPCAALVRKEKRNTFDGWLVNVIRGHKNRAKEVGVPFDLDIEYLTALWTGEDYYTGEQIEWCTESVNGTAPLHQASLDRVIPEKGYTKGNVQWVSKRTNMMKHNCTDDELYRFCELVLKRRNTCQNITLG